MEEEGLRRPAPPFSREHLQSRRGPQGGCVQTPASGRVLGGGAEVRWLLVTGSISRPGRW